jgi:phosphatidylglycerophosphate synthase
MQIIKTTLQMLAFKEKEFVPIINVVQSTILSKVGRTHIKEHKYKPGAYTPLDNILNPWWLRLTELLPRWLAPNLVTLAGFLPCVISYALAWYSSPTFTDPPPRWLCFTMAFSLFLYQTLDAMDGKQARRVGASTPLGQLFDHGCDCMACLSHHSMAAAVLMPGGSLYSLAGLSLLQAGFFMAQWEEKCTGHLCTSAFNNKVGVTETQYGLIALAAFGGILGPQALQDLMSIVVYDKEFTVSKLLISFWMVFCLFMIGGAFVRVWHHDHVDQVQGKWSMPENMRDHAKIDNRLVAMLDLIPMVILNFILLLGWHSEIITQMPRLLCFCVGLLFFYLTAQMIVFSMAQMPFRIIQPAMFPFAALAVASKFSYLPLELATVRVTLIIYTCALFYFVMCWLVKVSQELKEELGINVFTVGKKE